MCGRTRSCDRPGMPTVATTPDAGPHELGAYRSERPCGEDHRDRHPGYDLDEQAVYADWLRRRLLAFQAQLAEAARAKDARVRAAREA